MKNLITLERTERSIVREQNATNPPKVSSSNRFTKIREFKQIATAGADTAAGSKFSQK